MLIKFEGAIPGVAFSKHTYEGTVEGYVKFLKELEDELGNIPTIFGTNPNDKLSVASRLEKANKAIILIQKELPEAKKIIQDFNL